MDNFGALPPPSTEGISSPASHLERLLKIRASRARGHLEPKKASRASFYTALVSTSRLGKLRYCHHALVMFMRHLPGQLVGGQRVRLSLICWSWKENVAAPKLISRIALVCRGKFRFLLLISSLCVCARVLEDLYRKDFVPPVFCRSWLGQSLQDCLKTEWK